ncbi:site-specific integrase [Halobellus sp. Atlit-31R]|nr:site-specific integrase [Halobellus sp. Atlit-31R]
MNLRNHEDDDGKKVWLSQDEVDQLLDAAPDTEKRVAFALGARCGLRSFEVLDVAPQDVVDTEAGHMLRVWHGKGDKFRETPMPSDLATTIRTIGDFRDDSVDVPVIETDHTRTLRRWLESAREQLVNETGDAGWQFLSTHDLRRTWATALANKEVDPLLVLEWGGWDDLETFLDHYKGTYSPAAQRRARDKVDWL